MTKTRTLPKQQIIDALNEVFNIEELLVNHYRSFQTSNRSDADLLDICSRYLGKRINTLTHQTPWDGGSILAFIVAYEDYYDICLLDGMNYCYNKFALCKELFHVVIENAEFQSIDSDSNINQCVTGGALSGGASSEFVAEIAAMEYLFPFKKRLDILSQNQQIDFEAIASEYRIPRLLVEKFLTKFRMDTLSCCYIESSYKIGTM
jgi:hypothetical protein